MDIIESMILEQVNICEFLAVSSSIRMMYPLESMYRLRDMTPTDCHYLIPTKEIKVIDTLESHAMILYLMDMCIIQTQIVYSLEIKCLRNVPCLISLFELETMLIDGMNDLDMSRYDFEPILSLFLLFLNTVLDALKNVMLSKLA